MKIGVTGATGQVGRELVTFLKKSKQPAKLLCRDIKKLANQKDSFEITHFDFEDPSTYEQAIDGCDRIFLVCTSAALKSHLNTFLQLAEEKSVKQIVLISGLGVSTNQSHFLLNIEKIIESFSIPFVSLRANWFMQNFSSSFLSMVKEKKSLTFPDGRAPLSFIDAKDLAEVALYFLTHPISKENQYFDITGSESLTHEEIAQIFSKYLPYSVEYRELTEEEAKESLGWDDVWLELFRDIRKGTTAPVSDAVEKI